MTYKNHYSKKLNTYNSNILSFKSNGVFKRSGAPSSETIKDILLNEDIIRFKGREVLKDVPTRYGIISDENKLW